MLLFKILRDDTDYLKYFQSNNQLQASLQSYFITILDAKIDIHVVYESFISLAPHLSYTKYWKNVLTRYRDSLSEIILNSPPTKQPMILYRGVKTDYFLTDYMKNYVRNKHIASSFVSTSSSVKVAYRTFSDMNQGCCFMRIYVPSGSKCLLMSGISYYDHNEEAEFLLDYNTQFKIQKAKVKRFCVGGNIKYMRVSDLTIV